MNLKSSVLLLFLTLTWQVSLCSIKPDSLSKHNIGINFLRITDLEFYSGFSASYSNGINSPTGVYYQYKFASRYSGRIGVHYGSNSYTLENLQVFDGGTTLIQNWYKYVNIDLGVQYLINRNGRLHYFGLFDIYQRFGNGSALTLRQGYMTEYYFHDYDYHYHELGFNFGFGCNIPISDAISFAIESNLQVGQEISSNRPSGKLDYTISHFNPISRFSLNYRLNQKKSQH